MNQPALLPQQLPLQGPFRVQSGFSAKKIAATIALSIVALGVIALFGWYGMTIVNSIRETDRIWTNGIEAAGASLSGNVTTTKLILKHYKLDLSYQTPQGASLQHRVEFYRFFTGPNEGDAFTIRYLAARPEQATVSWAHDAIGHSWAWFVICILVTLSVVGGIISSIRKHLHERSLVLRLALEGQLIRAEVKSIEKRTETQGENKIEVTCYTYAFELNGPQTAEYKVRPKQQLPMLIEDDKGLVLLVSPNLAEHRVLNADGSPLVL